MPLYEFDCAECGPFTELRRVSERDMPADCPGCRTPAARMISIPRLAIMAATNRSAWQRNERSAHEPRLVSTGGDRPHQPGHKHDHGHGHPHTPRPSGHKHAHAGRPWMLGH